MILFFPQEFHSLLLASCNLKSYFSVALSLHKGNPSRKPFSSTCWLLGSEEASLAARFRSMVLTLAFPLAVFKSIVPFLFQGKLWWVGFRLQGKHLLAGIRFEFRRC